VSNAAVPTVPLAQAEVEYAPTFGRFEARGLLGRGGMGMVLRAYDPKLGRDVALKLIAPERWEAATVGNQRLELEARALAQLSHPNVVTVYDIGTVGEQPFIAMELVDGMTLRSWLSNIPRSEREILAMFGACARGLAAAHAAGLVHRDFKPDNVLIGGDGRPRVTDFGLVASDATSIKGVEGTPAYMAPEQWLGSGVDARADQFAFCVALWEALAGARPFRGSDDVRLREAVLAGAISAEPRPRRAFAAVLERGLAREPQDRWPSLDDLMRELERVAPRRRRWWFGGLALAAAGAGATIWLMARGADDTCTLRSHRIDEAWNAVARQRLASVFELTDPLNGPHVAEYVDAKLDTYATEWSRAEHALCTAEPSDINERRADCLEEARASFGRLVQVMTNANRSVIDRSSAAADNLLELAACDDAVALAASAPPPSDPRVRARMTEILNGINEANELALRGEHTKALVATKQIVVRARELGHAKSLALALEQEGDLEQDLGDLAAAEKSYRAGAEAAADARHDRLAAKLWSRLLFVGAEQGGDLTRVVALEPVADAAVRRAGNPPLQRFHFLMGSGVLAAWRTDLVTARARFAAAAELMKQEPRRRSEALLNLTIATFDGLGPRAALPLATETAELAERAHGPNHLTTALANITLSTIATRVGELDLAERTAAKALAIIERGVGRRAVVAGLAIIDLGIVAGLRGDFERAHQYFDETLAIHRVVAATDYDRASALAPKAVTLLLAGKAAESLPSFEQATALLDKAAPDSNEALIATVAHATALATAGRCKDARPLLDRVDPSLVKVPHLYADLLITRGVCEAVDDKPRGLATLERAVAHCREHPCELLVEASARYELAKRLPAGARERRRALATQARDLLSSAGIRIPLVAAAAQLRDAP